MYKSLWCRRAQHATTSDCSENRLQKAFSWMESMTLSLHSHRKQPHLPWAHTERGPSPRSSWWQGKGDNDGNSPSQVPFLRPGDENIGFVCNKIWFPWEIKIDEPQFSSSPLEKHHQLCWGSGCNRQRTCLIQELQLPSEIHVKRDSWPEGLGCPVPLS